MRELVKPYVVLNGIDITHSILESENDVVEVYFEKYSENQNNYMHATCVLPELKWTEIDNFPKEIINYLTSILDVCKNDILENALNE